MSPTEKLNSYKFRIRILELWWRSESGHMDRHRSLCHDPPFQKFHQKSFLTFGNMLITKNDHTDKERLVRTYRQKDASVYYIISAGERLITMSAVQRIA